MTMYRSKSHEPVIANVAQYHSRPFSTSQSTTKKTTERNSNRLKILDFFCRQASDVGNVLNGVAFGFHAASGLCEVLW